MSTILILVSLLAIFLLRRDQKKVLFEPEMMTALADALYMQLSRIIR